jgi:hypothetical protein
MTPMFQHFVLCHMTPMFQQFCVVSHDSHVSAVLCYVTWLSCFSSFVLFHMTPMFQQFCVVTWLPCFSSFVLCHMTPMFQQFCVVSHGSHVSAVLCCVTWLPCFSSFVLVKYINCTKHYISRHNTFIHEILKLTKIGTVWCAGHQWNYCNSRKIALS